MTIRDDSNPPANGAVSRREFFAGAGMTAGALAALGGGVGAAMVPAAQAAVKSREYFSTYVNFELDGQFAGRLLAARGGEPVIVPAAPATEYRGMSSLHYEPLTLRLGDMSIAVFDWVGKSAGGTAAGRNAAVVAFDSAGKEVYRLTMSGARLIEVKFDGFDAGATDAVRIEARIQPGQSSHDMSAKASYRGETFKQSPLLRSNFRLYIQGVGNEMINARSVDPVGVQARADGSLAPTALRFIVPLTQAAALFAWMNDTIAGKTGPRQGELQMLTRDLTRVAASVAFDQLSILRISCPVDATGDKLVSMVEVECLPAVTRFNMGDLLR